MSGPTHSITTPDDLDVAEAQRLFEELTLAILRDVAQGGGNRVADPLQEFVDFATATRVPIYRVIHDAIAAVSDRAFGSGQSHPVPGSAGLTRAALRVIVENVATDGAAGGRASKRLDSLDKAVRSWTK